MGSKQAGQNIPLLSQEKKEDKANHQSRGCPGQAAIHRCLLV
jgi:hypothetical protein